MSTPYLTLLEALRVSCSLPDFPDPLPSTQMDLELENGPTITIDFEEEMDCVEIFSQIGTYTAEQELEVLKKIAEANFFWTSTAGGTLSIRPEIQTIFLAHRAPVLSLNGTDFIALVENFVEVVTQWQKFLSGQTNTVAIGNGASEPSTREKEESTSLPPLGNSNFIIG